MSAKIISQCIVKAATSYLDEPDYQAAMNHVDDNYGFDFKKEEFKDILHKFIYGLPKKHCNAKEVLAYIRKNYPKADRKKLKGYIDGLDESRLEEFVGYVFKAVDKWSLL